MPQGLGEYLARQRPKAAEVEGGRWSVWCTSQHGQAWLKRGGFRGKDGTWDGTDTHEAAFSEAGAKQEADRLNAKADEDRMCGAYVTRRYRAELRILGGGS